MTNQLIIHRLLVTDVTDVTDFIDLLHLDFYIG